MKLKIGFLFIGVIMAFTGVRAQDVTTVEATDADISENLDLEAVASVFGEAKDLEDFEKRLNDPEAQISNLDLNEDGEVDYLRVVEASKGETHVVTIQAVIEKDKYQDVATIDVEKDSKGETQVQVVGDVYMYGPNYIIEPVYVHPPVIWVWFWGPYYNPWRSPYYYGYYPPYYRPWRPHPPHHYKRNVHVHVNVNNTYRTTTVRRSSTSVQIQNKNRRNDYGKQNPDRSYKNRSETSKNKAATPANNSRNKDVPTTTGRKVDDDFQTQSEKRGTKNNVSDGKVSVPTQKPATRPSTQPSTQPTQRPTTPATPATPATRPATPAAKPAAPATRPATPAAKPAARPATKPAAKPATRTKSTATKKR